MYKTRKKVIINYRLNVNIRGKEKFEDPDIFGCIKFNSSFVEREKDIYGIVDIIPSPEPKDIFTNAINKCPKWGKLYLTLSNDYILKRDKEIKRKEWIKNYIKIPLAFVIFNTIINYIIKCYLK